MTSRLLCLSEGHVTRVCDVMWCQINKQPLSVAQRPREGEACRNWPQGLLAALLLLMSTWKGIHSLTDDMTCKVIYLVSWRMCWTAGLKTRKKENPAKPRSSCLTKKERECRLRKAAAQGKGRWRMIVNEWVVRVWRNAQTLKVALLHITANSTHYRVFFFFKLKLYLSIIPKARLYTFHIPLFHPNFYM